MKRGRCKVVQQFRYDAVTGQLDIDHNLRFVDFGRRHFGACFVGLAQRVGQMVDQRFGKCAAQNLLFVCHKSLCRSIYQQPDGCRTQIGYLLVGIAHHTEYLMCTCLALLRQKSHQQLFGLVQRKKTQLVGIFNVHYLVANVVGGFDQINQRMARKTFRPCRVAHNAKCIGYLFVGGFVALKKPEFVFMCIGILRFVRIFYD